MTSSDNAPAILSHGSFDLSPKLVARYPDIIQYLTQRGYAVTVDGLPPSNPPAAKGVDA